MCIKDLYYKDIELVRINPEVNSGFRKHYSNKKEETIIYGKYNFVAYYGVLAKIAYFSAVSIFYK